MTKESTLTSGSGESLVFFFTHPPIRPLPTQTLYTTIFSFALVIITTATRGLRLTINVSMGGNKLLAQMTYAAIFPERMARGFLCAN